MGKERRTRLSFLLGKRKEDQMKVTDLVASFAKPLVEQHGCQLWDVE